MLSQKTLFPHAGRKENTIVANSNKIYVAMTHQPAVSWKCSWMTIAVTHNPETKRTPNHIGICRGRRLL
jgi:hypothetical protein